MTIGELIETLGGKLAQGDQEWAVDGVSSSDWAKPSDLVFAEDTASGAAALASDAGTIVLRAGCVESYPPGRNVIETAQPRLWFARAGQLVKPILPATGVHSSAAGRRASETWRKCFRCSGASRCDRRLTRWLARESRTQSRSGSSARACTSAERTAASIRVAQRHSIRAARWGNWAGRLMPGW